MTEPDPAEEARAVAAPEPGGASAVVAPEAAADENRHPKVDEALQALAQTRGLTPADQIAGYEAVHRTLQETLATIDEGQS